MKQTRPWSILLLLFTLMLGVLLNTSEADARGGRSFGGFRSRSYAPSRPATPSKPRSGGWFRSSSPSTSSAPKSSYSTSRSSSSAPRSSFGGTRLGSAQEYTRSYGIPRRTEQMSIPSGGGGMAQNYVVHRYGGSGDGFMMGYLTGASSWMWSMPFHPAFYYTRPYYVQGPNGMEVYPPTFSWAKLFMVVLIVGGIAYFVMARRRRSTVRSYSRSSFG